MIIENLHQFNKFLLWYHINDENCYSLNGLKKCIHKYATTCGCEPERKAAKLEDCKRKYRFFVKNDLKERFEKTLKEIDKEFIFLDDGEFFHEIKF